ncbi:uncharacterized protein LTR77_007305 [Saxophila tyrrhenica]|uniref:DUF1308 domain-containing protein n=1 Tax=Saxophila tyrrhenica TaxID=1690608 RepID=A0AAV9P4C2_9PEZI|nr:hypothetical protein LTR77_007305 [Saxophila tyrrhenica]
MDDLNDRSDGTANASTADDTPGSSPLVNDLVIRANAVLSELEAFRERLKQLRMEGTVETAHFKNTIKSELGMLDKLADKPESDATNHIARSSNLPFLEACWTTAKRSKDVTALLKRLFFNAELPTSSNKVHSRPVGKSKKSKKMHDEVAKVDVIDDGGRTWTKISLVTNTRLLFDLAKEGWDSGGSDNESEDAQSDAKSADDDTEIPLVKTARELARASKAFRVRTRHPVVYLILPRIKLGETPEVDNIIEKCRKTGVIVICGEDTRPPVPFETAAPIMATDVLTTFSDVLNIDCTILLALVSEFSHAKVSKEPWFHTALQRQVEIEDNENLLPSLLYPAMKGHPLVCTFEAAKRMREIVDTIGTPSEKARTAIFMGNDTPTENLISELQEWSAYAVPSDLQLPIRVLEQDQSDLQSSLPKEAASVREHLTEINNSVFMYGWATGRTTITSNRIVTKQIDSELEQFSDLDDSVWPKIWLCPTARSLVGKEKRSAAKAGKDQPWRMPDPLRREQQRRNGLDVLSEREGKEVEDLRPNGYPCEEVIAAKMASLR